MTCTSPVFAFQDVKGSKLDFNSNIARGHASRFYCVDMEKEDFLIPEGVLPVPCGRCMNCRLKKARSWAVRIMHESQMWPDNCFVTLTYDEENIPPGGSLVKRDLQLFMKKLRRHFDGRTIRYYGVGEYGENLSRPHYHLILFNCFFEDQYVWTHKDGYNTYVSDTLMKLWPQGHSLIGDCNSDTAMYCAGYVTKKYIGSDIDSVYGGKLPEFALMSRRPGIGKLWFDNYGQTDIVPHDNVVFKGHEVSIPRYYDNLIAKEDPDLLGALKARRKLVAEAFPPLPYSRLKDKAECVESRLKERQLELFS